jgi:pantoate--beta-alanine ligase
LWTASTIDQLRTARRALRGTVGFVPTMGALHDGHLQLIRHARTLCDHVLVSIFVNPTQFAPNEDFTRYPRTLDADLKGCESAGAAGVFYPDADEMYPLGQPECSVNVPALTADLEATPRPTHFAGVCRVVLKLFNIVQADVACFGQKDYQQLRVVQAMVADVNLPLRVVGVPTVREADGLAMSSRNRFLNAEQRQHARGLFKALTEAKMLVEQAGEVNPQRVEDAMSQIMRAHHFEVDYATVRHPRTLAKLDCIEPAVTGGVVALVAGRMGPVRLLDNMVLAGKL